jgi:hypothetical protein
MALAQWASLQRVSERKGKFSPARKARLDELGFAWDPQDAAWEIRFAELKRYRDEYGHCNVPFSWSENPQLGSWVVTQRMFQKEGRLSIQRKARLDMLGFSWHAHDAAWEAMFAELQRYKKAHGHCSVSRNTDNPKLGTWVATQRSWQRAGRLSAERKARLDELGFEWTLESNRSKS